MGSKSLDGVIVKRAHRKETFSEDQIQQLMQCLDPEKGYHYFCEHFFYIQHPVKGQMLFQPFSYQTRLLDAYHNHRFTINMLPRQMGKTTCAAGYLLWYAMFNPNKTILIAAHKYTGSQEIMQRVRFAYELCPDHIRGGVINYNKQSIEFDNGSRIVSTTTTENTGRGMSISLLYCDEFAFVEPNIASEFWTSISPTLATGGRAIITSTPNSDEDEFSRIWKEANKKFDEYGNELDNGLGINGFHAFTCHWNEHPDRDEDWAREERGRIGEERFRREYNCEFLIYDETLINSIHLSNMEGANPVMNMGQTRWYKTPKAGNVYVLSLDPSLGTGGDYAAIQIVELPSFEQVAEWHHNETPIQQQIKICKELLTYIKDTIGEANVNDIYWSIENNNIGEAGLVVIKDLGEEQFPGLFVSEPIRKGHVRKFRKGFNTTHKTKIAACARMKHLIESNTIKVNSKPLISELKAFIAHGITFKAKSGEHDDLVSSLLLIVRMTQVLADWDPRVFERISVRDSWDEEDFEPPMPIFVSSTV
jgi:hypothetical protein